MKPILSATLVFTLARVLQSSAAPAPDPAAVQEVLAGRREVAQAAWWGFDPQDATAALQAAIRSGAKKVIVAKMDSPWRVEPLRLASDQEIVFEPGVEVVARRGSFRGTGDSLFTGWDCRNVTLTGPGATLRMWREDYATTNYAKGEWRHVLSLRGCTNVTITGLTLAESGGDGIYISVGKGGGPCVNVRVRDVVCDRNYRQGVSVISAENLLLENCVLRGTGGTAPMAGIDFEPNHPSERLVNCVLRRCVVENNQGQAFLFALHQLNATSAPVSIRLEECISRGTNRGSVYIHARNGVAPGAVKGEIEFVKCAFEDTGAAGALIRSKPADGVQLRFDQCVFAEAAAAPSAPAMVYFSTVATDTEPAGGVVFADCVLRETTSRPPMLYRDIAGVGIAKLTGNLLIERAGLRSPLTLDQPTLNQLMPTAAFPPIAPYPMAGRRLEPLHAREASRPPRLPAHRLRGEAQFILSARRGEAVTLRLECQQVGRNPTNPMPVRVTDDRGREVANFSVPVQPDTACTFTAPETGLYRIACDAKHNRLRLVSASHPVALGGGARAVHFMGTAAELYFVVPAGVREFGVKVSGDNEGERVKAEVLDAAGKSVWTEDSIAMTRLYVGRPSEAARDEVWRLRVSKPAEGAFEDFHVDLRGIPNVFAFEPEALLRPVPSHSKP